MVLVWRFRAVRAVISGFVRLVCGLVLLLLRGGFDTFGWRFM